MNNFETLKDEIILSIRKGYDEKINLIGEDLLINYDDFKTSFKDTIHENFIEPYRETVKHQGCFEILPGINGLDLVFAYKNSKQPIYNIGDVGISDNLKDALSILNNIHCTFDNHSDSEYLEKFDTLFEDLEKEIYKIKLSLILKHMLYENSKCYAMLLINSKYKISGTPLLDYMVKVYRSFVFRIFKWFKKLNSQNEKYNAIEFYMNPCIFMNPIIDIPCLVVRIEYLEKYNQDSLYTSFVARDVYKNIFYSDDKFRFITKPDINEDENQTNKEILIDGSESE